MTSKHSEAFALGRLAIIGSLIKTINGPHDIQHPYLLTYWSRNKWLQNANFIFFAKFFEFCIYASLGLIVVNQYLCPQGVDALYIIVGHLSSQIAKFMGPTWVLSAPDGPNVGPMNCAIRGLTAQSHLNWLALQRGYRQAATQPGPVVVTFLTVYHGDPILKAISLLTNIFREMRISSDNRQ